MTEYADCPKCGYRERGINKYQRKYQDRCYTHECKWVDTDVREHMHVHCPDCGYQVGVEPCNDYKELKNAKPKGWTGVGTLNNKAVIESSSTTQRTFRSFKGGQGYVDVPVVEEGGGWDTAECPECPMAKEENAST